MRTLETGMRSEQGVTLVELLVVLAILATLASLTGVVAGTLGARRLERECASTYTWLRSLRRNAMLTGTTMSAVAEGSRLRSESGAVPPHGAQGTFRMSVASADSHSGKLCFFAAGSGCAGVVAISRNSDTCRVTVDRLGDIRIE